MRCHPERSEGSLIPVGHMRLRLCAICFDCEVLRCAQDDILVERWALNVERWTF